MPQQPKGKPLDRKAARRQARDEKKQRKAQHYDNKKKFEKQQKKQDWLQRHPEILQKMQQNNSKNAKNHASSLSAPSSKRSIGEGNPKNVPIKKRKIVTPQRAPFMADVTEDPLLAFAERALDEGILGSDGEFDEDRMNKLFAGEEYSDAEDEDEEISIDSDDEDYLLGKTRPENDPADDMEGENDDDVDEEIDVESDSSLSNDEENQDQDDDEIDVENDSEEEEKPTPKTKTQQSVAAAPSDAEKTLQRTVQGHINKLTMSNFDSVASAIASLYRSHPRHYVTEAVANAITASITKQANLLDSFILNFSALVAALVHLVGVDFAAVILEKCVPILDQNKALAKQQAASVDEEEEGISPARIVMNTATLLSYLYDLQVISSLAISNIIDEALVELSELDVEILVKLIRNCGAQLRRDDAMALKDVVSKITARVASVPSADQSSRFKFMVETIYDLKNNRQKLVAVQHSELESIKKILRNILTQNNISKLEPLHVSLSDVRTIKSKGAWWRVGAAWNPEAGPKTDKDNAPVKSRPKDSQESKLLELAKKQGMNTDIRRSIFVTLLSSEDYLDAFHRLIALKLTGKQEKEVAYVLLHCCLHERNYNPFYALVASKFTESRHNFVITFKYSLWDRLKELTEEADEEENMESKKSLREKIHAAKFYGYLMGKQNLSLSVLKRASFTQLSEDAILFMQVLLITVMETAPDEVDLASIFGEIAQLARGKGSSKKKHRGHADDDDDDLFGPDADADGGEEKDEDQEVLQKQELEALQVGLRLFIRQYLSLSGSTGKHISSIISNKEQFTHRLQIVLSSLQ